jgi:hypothetical protein
MAEFWQWRGDLPTGSGYVMLKDGAGRQGMNTVFGDAIVAGRETQINVQFQYNISTYDVTTTTVDTGTVTQSEHTAIVSTGSGVSGSATVHSVDSLRYIPGHEGYALFTTIFSTPVDGVNQKIGIYDDENGFYLGFIGLDFVVGRRRDGIDFLTYQSEFNLNKLDGSGREWTAVDFTKGNVWRITYGWLGFATINFEVMEKDGSWTAFHKIEYPNNFTETNIGNPVLPIRMKVLKTNGTATANVTLTTGSWNAGIVNGLSECCNRYQSFSATAAITAANSLHNIFTLKSVSSFQTLTNKVRTIALFLSAACDGTKLTSVRLIKNATLGVTATYTYIDSGNSTIQYDTTSTTVSSGTTLLTLQLGKTDSKTIDLEGLFVSMYPNDTLTFAAISLLATDVSISTRWKEEF